MRVLCSTLDGSKLEGEVIGGNPCDEVSGEINLKVIFTVRIDQDVNCFIHGWLVDVVGLDKRERVM